MKRMAFALCLCAPALLAQQEPTPFWLPPPAPIRNAAPTKQKPAPPAKHHRPGETEVAPPVKPPLRKKRVEVEPPDIGRSQKALPEANPRAAPEAAPSLFPTAAPPPKPATPEGPAAVVADTPGAEPVPDEPRGPARRFSIDLNFGLWGKSPIEGGGRSYDVAYGLRFGYELLPGRVELELLALRAGRTAGTAFANATTTHNLLALRAFYLLGAGRFTALLGGGAGTALAQTHYTVQDVGGTPVSLDATSARLVVQVTAGARARVYRGLDLRAEVSAVLRDGKLDVLPLAGAGWAF